MSNKTLNLTAALYDYICNNSLRESPVLKHLRRATATMPGSNMQIAPEQGQFMAFLVKLIGARKTLEVGTYTGYSALAVAEALPHHGKLIACDIDPKTGEVAKQFWQQAGLAHKIDLRIGQASDTMQQLLDEGQAGTFDFIFIDADKRGYDLYYELALQLLRRGGLIALDNMLRDGRVVAPSDDDKSTLAIHALNQKLHHDERVELSLIPIADGLTLVRKK